MNNTTVNGNVNVAPIAALKRQIEAQPANVLPDLLACIVRRCVQAKLFPGRSLSDVVAGLESRVKDGGPPL